MLADSTKSTFEYTFPNGQTAHILNVPDNSSYAGTLTALGLAAPAPSMVVIGGASNMSPESKVRVAQLFTKVLAPIAETYGITVFDGGTEAGVIQMMGEARHHVDGSFHLVGVAPKAKVNLPGHPFNLNLLDLNKEHGELTTLEEHHTHFALVPGVDWGHESPWLAHFASLLAAECPSITILINGGKISLSDLVLNLSVGQKTIIISGSGRLADEIANTVDNTKPSDNTIIQNLVKTYYPSQLYIFDLSSSLDILTNHLRLHFTTN